MKSLPWAVRPEVLALRVPPFPSMSRRPLDQLLLSIEPDLPLMVAVQLVSVTSLRCASGNTPLDDAGASTIHSAELLLAFAFIVCDVGTVVVTFLVWLFKVILKVSFPS